MQSKVRSSCEIIYQNACQVIPGGVNSPVRNFSDVEVPPLIVDKAIGDTIYDADSNAYIDYCTSWGGLILGHSPDPVVKALEKQLKQGTSFGISTSYEYEIAKKIVELVPSVEKVRFVSTGTEATMTAIRLARGYTKKPLIIKFQGNYHGHHDALLVQSGSSVSYLNPEATSEGVLPSSIQSTITLPYNDQKALDEFFASEKKDDVAAVIIEPIAGNMGLIPAKHAFLQALKEYSKKNDFLLVFDEVISGFRVGLEGAQGYYGVHPDLTCFGKIVGGGLPAALIGGKAEVMDLLAPSGKVFQAGTLSGNPLAMRAGLATLQVLERDGIYEELEDKTRVITDPIREELKNTPHSIHSVGSMFSIFWNVKNPQNKTDLAHLDMDIFKKYFQFLLKKGIYIPQSPFETSFVSLAHSKENLQYTRDVILDFIQ
ncbi:MAG: glutamate-1-semialdehyde 2,1-aminomutase [Chlamydiota bacterium]|jgi:glutamate-1-semialdehyde 2,1-aminomutase